MWWRHSGQQGLKQNQIFIHQTVKCKWIIPPSGKSGRNIRMVRALHLNNIGTTQRAGTTLVCGFHLTKNWLHSLSEDQFFEYKMEIIFITQNYCNDSNNGASHHASDGHGELGKDKQGLKMQFLVSNRELKGLPFLHLLFVASTDQTQPEYSETALISRHLFR